MLVLRSHSISVSILRPKLFHVLSCLDFSTKIKLAEVPDVCNSEEWHAIVQKSRAQLQNCVKKHRIVNAGSSANLATEQMVTQRLLTASRGSTHLIDTFKYLLDNSDEAASLLRWPGLIILMLSQGIGNPFTADNFISQALEDVIWSSQVVLAEIINTLHCSLIFQRENWRVSSTRKTNNMKAMSEVERLMNSYFTSSSIYKLSALKNPKVIFLLSDVLESLAKTKRASTSSTFKRLTNKKLWEYETFHSQGVMLANGCQAALELAGHDDKSQEAAFEFGHLFALAIKANADIQQFWNYQKTKSTSLNLSGFPIALHLGNNPETMEHIYSCGEEMDNLDTDQLNSRLVSSSSLDEAKLHLEKYVSKTLSLLQEFRSYKNAEMVEHLIKLVKTLNHINEK